MADKSIDGDAAGIGAKRNGPVCAPYLTKAASLRPPPNAVDTHFHVFAAPARYPFTPGRSYTPPEAPLEAYLRLQDTLGLAYGVLVQPSVYGADNRLLLDILRSHGDRFRGIAVIDPQTSDRDLEALDAAGVRGVRMNLLFRGGMGIEDAEHVAPRIGALGWHLQVLIDVSESVETIHRLGRLGLPLVFDHIGHMAAGKGVRNAGFQTMLTLLREGRAWVKLSGAYRLSAEPRPPYRDVAPLVQAILETAPDRALWGSDWPHPSISKPTPDDGELLDLLADWAPDPTLRRRILRDNPAALYGFASSPPRSGSSRRPTDEPDRRHLR